MSMDRRAFMQALGLGAGAAYLGSTMPHAWAHGAPGAPRRFVFVLEGSGLEPGKLLTPAARAAIEDHATGSLLCHRVIKCGGLWANSDEVPLDPAMNQLYGHDAPLVINEDPLSSAGTLGALAEGEWGPSLEAKSAVVLGLSSLITGGGESTYGGALSCTRSGPKGPAGQSIDALLATYPSVRQSTPFDALRLGIGKSAEAIVQGTSSFGPGRPAPVIFDYNIVYDMLFGSVHSAASARQFAAHTHALTFARRNVIRRIATFEGPNRALHKLRTYKLSIDEQLLRHRRLADMGDALRAVVPPPLAQQANGYAWTPHLVRLANHFQLATAALLGALTNVVVIASGSGGYGLFDVDYRQKYPHLGLPLPSVGGRQRTRQAVLRGRPTNPVDHRILYEATARHVQHIAEMARALDAVPEGDGTMLDNTAIIYMSDNGEQHHSLAEEWPMLLVGGGNMGLQTGGRTLVYPRVGRPQNRQVSNLFNTLGYCAGQQLDDFGGEGARRIARGPLPELWQPPG